MIDETKVVTAKFRFVTGAQSWHIQHLVAFRFIDRLFFFRCQIDLHHHFHSILNAIYIRHGILRYTSNKYSVRWIASKTLASCKPTPSIRVSVRLLLHLGTTHQPYPAQYLHIQF
jgi:hypothetical protein